MRKSLFVIPKVLFINVLVFLVIIFLPSKTSAVDNTGCVISFGTELHVYYLINPVIAGTYITSSDDPTTPAGYRRKRASDASICVDDFGGSCSIYFTNGTTLFATGTTSHIYDCPIDDYIPLLAIFTLSLGLYKIRRSNLKAPVYEDKLNHGSV
ncbi:MAG: hypothetical protein EOO87_12455 [Pedobacter sp.]|nr:MAG: hypothetical protein EOO87_12455 [Pedobacter sp.]